jgi:hypothetical protein
MLAAIKPRQLFVAADGPRPEIDGEYDKCDKVRSIVDSINWECEIKTLFRESNLGCRKAVSNAISWFFQSVEEGIILEDDCLPSPSFFFTFCAEMLQRYRHDEKIMMISGNNFQNGIRRGNASYYFSQIPNVWGWATWKNAWNKYDESMDNMQNFKSLTVLKNIYTDQNIIMSWQYAFALTIYEEVNSWGYRWAYNLFKEKKLSIVPNVNMVRNIGLNSGTHTSSAKDRIGNMELGEIDNLIHPENLLVDTNADIYEYEKKYRIYPKKDCMSILYRWRRYRRRRRLKIKISSLINKQTI